MQLELCELERYLEERAGTTVQIEGVHQLRDGTTGTAALKQFGYGRPLLVSYRVGDREEQVVLHRIRRNAFGRERDDDRVAAVWLDFQTFNRLPRHVPAVDMVIHTREGNVQSIHSAKEVLLVTGYRPGHPYADDLMRIRDEGTIRSLDIQRTKALAAYLAEIHQVTHKDPVLWRRRLRDLVGHGEGIMGLTDSYPQDLPYVTQAELQSIEEMANGWRWRLKPLSNYLFFSLQRMGWLEGPFAELHDRFWERYLALRPDKELARVIQPWFAWRALVLASPKWYPTISEGVRRKLLTFGQRVMALDRFDYRQVNQYMEDA